MRFTARNGLRKADVPEHIMNMRDASEALWTGGASRQKRTDDHAFPVRVKILVPERGFENLLLDMHRWLSTAPGLIPLSDWLERHGCPSVAMEATGIYWRPVWQVLASEDRTRKASARSLQARRQPREVCSPGSGTPRFARLG